MRKDKEEKLRRKKVKKIKGNMKNGKAAEIEYERKSGKMGKTKWQIGFEDYVIRYKKKKDE